MIYPEWFETRTANKSNDHEELKKMVVNEAGDHEEPNDSVKCYDKQFPMANNNKQPKELGARHAPSTQQPLTNDDVE